MGDLLTLPVLVAPIDHVITAPHVWLLQEGHNIDRTAKERHCTNPPGLGAFGVLLGSFAVLLGAFGVLLGAFAVLLGAFAV